MLTQAMSAAAPHLDINGTLFLVNREHMVDANYLPELRAANVPGTTRLMRPDAAEALEEMFAAAKTQKIALRAVSGYRNYQTQATIYKGRIAGGTKKSVVDAYVAIPGASEHQLGLAMDVGKMTGSNLTAAFGKSKEGQWLAKNCWKYGFIIRYQEGWEDITGYNAEPWHVRYVGKEYARMIYERKVPLETFLADLQVSLLIDMIKRDPKE